MAKEFVSGFDKVSDWVKQSRVIQSIEKLPGDASTRRYFRVYAEGNSYIVMKRDPFSEKGESLPFLQVQKHLESVGIDVPKVYDIDPEMGFMLLEDLGDTTFLRQLQGVGDLQTEKRLFEKVIDVLTDLHVKASSPGEEARQLEAFQSYFDEEKLMWEVNFTFQHFYETYLDRRFSEKEEALLFNSFSEICRVLAAEPTVFTHRDFHSRNVMVSGKNNERFTIIDFQDARMGPMQYDLASLLKDSYYQLQDSQVECLIHYYISEFEKKTSQKLDRAHFVRVFDYMSIQRNFKAIGSFASFLNRRGNHSYLKFIGNTFENIRRTLLKYPEFSDLREVLFHYYYF